MKYTLLTPEIFDQLHTQRIIDLEADHYRVELRRLEAVDSGEIAGLEAQQAEIERRIRVHQDVPAHAAATDHAEG
ncbi:MAG TPA: hypothetical protein VE155_02715 [Pseudonocardiaceae bacterium]|nr:hypothetical protein [Pseudonocardiaceae bacterium]